MGTPKEDLTICPVCGYAAEGNHYGILSCRSCASFFKRVVEKGDVSLPIIQRRSVVEFLSLDKKVITFQSFDRHPPPIAGESFTFCNIKENRNSCKQCRYLKCLETGMQPSGKWMVQ